MRDTVKSALTIAGIGAVSMAAFYLSQSYVADDVVEEKDQETTESEEMSLIKAGIKKIGDGNLLFPDYVGGLREAAAKAAKNENGLGYIDNFGQPIVIVSRPEHAFQVLKYHTRHKLGGLEPASIAFFGEQVLFVLEGQEWRKLRNVMHRSFVLRKTSDMSSTINETANELAKKLDEIVKTQDTVDMHYVFGMFHLSAIGKCAFGFDLNCVSHLQLGSNAIVDAFEYLLKELPRRAYSQDTHIREDFTSDNQDNRDWNMHAKKVRDEVQKMVEARLKERGGQKNTVKDLLDALIATYEEDQNSERKVDDNAAYAAQLTKALGDNLIELLFAGFATVAATAASAVHYVSIAGPELQERLCKEANEVLGESSENAKIDVNLLPLTKAVFMETLRMDTPVPLIARDADTETILESGVSIPPCAVWIPVVSIQTDPSVWGKDAAEFNPYRWLNGQAEPTPGSFLAFSSGSRGCIGRNFAMIEGVAALASLFKRFSVTPDPAFKYKSTFTGYTCRPLDLATGNVCVNVKLTPRDRAFNK